MEYIRSMYDDASRIYDDASRYANQMTERLATSEDEQAIIPSVINVVKGVSKKCGHAARYGRRQSIHAFGMIAGSEDYSETANPTPKPRAENPAADGAINQPARPDTSYTIVGAPDNRGVVTAQGRSGYENETERGFRNNVPPLMMPGPQSELQQPPYLQHQQQQLQHQQQQLQRQQLQRPLPPWPPHFPPTMPPTQQQLQQQQLQRRQPPLPPNWPQMFLPMPPPQPQNQPPPPPPSRPPFLSSFLPFMPPGSNRHAPQIPPPHFPPMPQSQYQMYNFQPPPPVKVDRQVQHPSNSTLHAKRCKEYKQPCSALHTTIIREDDPYPSVSMQKNSNEDKYTIDCRPYISDWPKTCQTIRRRSRSARSARKPNLVSKCCVENAVYRKLLQLMTYPQTAKKCVNRLRNDHCVNAQACSQWGTQKAEIPHLNCYQESEQQIQTKNCPLVYSCPWAKLVSDLQQHTCIIDKTGCTWPDQDVPDADKEGPGDFPATMWMAFVSAISSLYFLDSSIYVALICLDPPINEI